MPASQFPVRARAARTRSQPELLEGDHALDDAEQGQHQSTELSETDAMKRADSCAELGFGGPAPRRGSVMLMLQSGRPFARNSETLSERTYRPIQANSSGPSLVAPKASSLLALLTKNRSKVSGV